MTAAPYLIQFDQIGNTAEGVITTTQFASKLPFPIWRVFWLQVIPGSVIRGQHANKLTEEVLIAISGSIKIKAETAGGTQVINLEASDQGLYIPALCWTELSFEKDTIGLCLASTDFDAADYIRDYKEFKQLISK